MAAPAIINRERVVFLLALLLCGVAVLGLVRGGGEQSMWRPDDLGVLTISQTVLEEIACTEAMDTPGVVPPRETVMQGVLRRHGPHGVRVEVSGQGAEFHLTVGVREGVRMPDVATEVRRRVASAVRAKTGYAVWAVNLVVDHVAFEGEPPADA